MATLVSFKVHFLGIPFSAFFFPYPEVISILFLMLRCVSWMEQKNGSRFAFILLVSFCWWMETTDVERCQWMTFVIPVVLMLLLSLLLCVFPLSWFSVLGLYISCVFLGVLTVLGWGFLSILRFFLHVLLVFFFAAFNVLALFSV